MENISAKLSYMDIKETDYTNKIVDSTEDYEEKEFNKRIGIAKGKYILPDNIDECNDEIARMFGMID